MNLKNCNVLNNFSKINFSLEFGNDLHIYVLFIA